MAAVDYSNRQLVHLRRGNELSIFVQVGTPARIMTRRDALIHAAWLVATAETEDGQFEAIYRGVKTHAAKQ